MNVDGSIGSRKRPQIALYSQRLETGQYSYRSNRAFKIK